MCQALFKALGDGAVIDINNLLLCGLHSSYGKQIRCKKKRQMIPKISGNKHHLEK